MLLVNLFPCGHEADMGMRFQRLLLFDDNIASSQQAYDYHVFLCTSLMQVVSTACKYQVASSLIFTDETSSS